MYDFEDMIRRAVENIGDGDVAVAMPYDRPRRVMEELHAAGVIAGAIADDAEEGAAVAGAAGWWIDRDAGDIHFVKGGPRTLAYVGVGSSFRMPGRMLRRAFFRGGKSRVVSVDPWGGIVEDADLSRIRVLGSTIRNRLRGSSDPAVHSFAAGYDALFDEMGDELRLPAQAFDPRRVLLFIGSLGPGGAERQASYLAAELARRGEFEVHIACLNLSPPSDFFLAEARAAGVNVFEMQRDPPELAEPCAQRAMKRLTDQFHAIAMPTLLAEILMCASAIRRLRPGVVHTWMDHHNALGGAAVALVGAPVLISGGRSQAPDHFRIFQPFMKPGYQSVLARRHAHMLNNSTSGARDYERWLGLAQGAVETIHNGYLTPAGDKQEMRRRQRKELDLDLDDLVVGSILRFSEEKRPDYLLETAIEIHRRRPSVRFVFFGDGPMRSGLESRVKQLGLVDVIQMPGHTSQPWEALSALDLFMLASRMEGLPNVLIEAQLMGVPVLCTGAGGMAETIIPGETGIIASGPPERFADAAIRLFDDAQRLTSMSKAAALFSRATFSIDTMYDRTVATYSGRSNEDHSQAR